MGGKIVRRTLFAIPALLLAYLGIAAVWASTSVDQLMAAFPPAAGPVTLSPRQQHILLKIEDPTFFQHKGLSLADGQGVTTISSSIARAVFLERSDLQGVKGGLQDVYRGVFACCKKVDFGRDAMALVLDAHVSKQRQLDLFTSQIYMGASGDVQVRGLEQASQLYFNKPLKELGEADFVGLVSMIKAPNQFHPLHTRPAFELRRARVARIVAGECQPAGWFDTSYEDCKTID